MRLAFCLWVFLSFFLKADENLPIKSLNSESFQERQQAEQELINWAKQEDPEKRADQLFERYLKSEDPEEFRRLTRILLAVHFDLKKEDIPQQGSGFIGISMRQPRPFRFQQRRFEQGQLQLPPLEQDEFEKEAALERGVFIDEVIEGTPAEKAGLLAEDLITEIDGEDLAGEDPTARLKEIVGGRPPGTKLTLTIEREEKLLKKVITLMNAQAVPQIRPNGGQPRVDAEKADQLLRNDYLRWLTEQRSIHQAQ